jgi:type II secretory ATPase GspE/PulE/Tfp pilus assembly ATPase PilB-like protein
MNQCRRQVAWRLFDAIAVTLLAPLPAFAQAADALTQPWPGVRDSAIRGQGGYLSWWNLLLCVVVFWAWVKTADWISRDAREHPLNHRLWNPVVVAAFPVGLALLLLLPSFALAFPLLILAYLAPAIAYVLYRNRRVLPDETVLTKAHIRYVFSRVLRPFGLKVAGEKVDPREAIPLTIMPRGGATDHDDRANLLVARRQRAFLPVQRLLADGFDLRANAVLIDAQATQTAVKLLIDGVWHDMPGESPGTGAGMINVLKTLTAVGTHDEKPKSTGTFAAAYSGRKASFTANFTATDGGQKALLKRSDAATKFATLADLGLREKPAQALDELMGRDRGMILFSALPGNGLTTTINTALANTDRYMREFYAIEDADNREEEVENVAVATYRAAAGQTPATILPDVLRRYPNALVVRQLPDADTARRICEQAEKERFVVTSIAAKDAVEALLRVLALRIEPELFARAIMASVNQRLIRKLCDHCKESYEPMGNVLSSLGLPADRVKTLYRAVNGPQSNPARPKDPPQPCPACSGIGYVGRTAIFEILIVDDALRRLLVEQPKLDVLRAAARKGGRMRTLQEDGALLVAEGRTSVEELTRILKQ